MKRRDRGDDLGKPIKVAWHIPEEWKTSRYATNFTIQFSGHEYILSFYEASPPLLIGSQEEIRQQVEKLESVPAECVARISLSPGRFAELIRLLVENAGPEIVQQLESLLVEEKDG